MTQQSIPFPVDNGLKEQLQQIIHPRLTLPWIQVAKDAPYFVTDEGKDWTPIGQNDAITWPELKGIFLRKDLATAEAYFQKLVQHGVTCLRLMLEYCQGEHRYFEKPIGRFNPNMVRMWDDIFLLCEQYGLRVLLTPYDTFWMWLRWSHHPYKKSNSGVCDKRSQWLLCPETRTAIKQRLSFATNRWGKSGALFAWDIWNEIHPAHAANSAECFTEFVQDVGSFLRSTELRIHGRSHPQTVSVFGPVIEKDPLVVACAFKHPALDFASVHFYESNTIDNPRNTVDAAISTGRLTRQAISNIDNARPFFDSEHGPIHAFKDRKRTLPEPFDDEYFRHMQWAHFASGGAGGGMRWPNRNPHSLTMGMREAQQALANFLPLINWQEFRRTNLNDEVRLPGKNIVAFSCGDSEQAILWLLRSNTITKNGLLNRSDETPATAAFIPGLTYGTYQVTSWDTKRGHSINTINLKSNGSGLQLPVPAFTADIAFAIRRTGD